MEQSPLSPGLYIVATPIGNLNDLSFRAANVLKGAALVAVEDTRVTGKLLKHIGSDARMIRYDEHQGDRTLPEILQRAESAPVALVSDAGTPLISDPGYRLVTAAREADIPVFAIPGPSAAIAALSISGLPTDRFLFMGFLPPKSGARKAALREIANLRATLVFYESGKRLASFLADAHEVLGARDVRAARELTKLHEECVAFRLGAVPELETRGEFVIVVGPPQPAEAASETDIDAALRGALEGASLKDAVAAVTTAFGLPRKQVYERALVLKAESR